MHVSVTQQRNLFFYLLWTIKWHEILCWISLVKPDQNESALNLQEACFLLEPRVTHDEMGLPRCHEAQAIESIAYAYYREKHDATQGPFIHLTNGHDQQLPLDPDSLPKASQLKSGLINFAPVN